MTVVVETPTHEQLGISKARLVLRGVMHRCPVCGARGSIVRWFGITDRCPHCHYGFHRIDGHEIGYIGLNTVVCFSLTFVALLIGTILMAPNISSTALIVAGLIPAGLGPIILLPSCRLAWVALDLLFRPLQPGDTVT